MFALFDPFLAYGFFVIIMFLQRYVKGFTPSEPKATSKRPIQYDVSRRFSMEPIIDHIQITVKDMDVAVPFYDKFLPLLGFDRRSRNGAVIEAHDFHVVEYSNPQLGF